MVRPLLLLLVLVLAAAFASAQNKLYGAGFVPFMADGGDEVEKRIHRAVGEMPEVDQMFNINDGEHLLETLVKLKAQGKKLDFMVLGGHGAKTDPHIGFAKGDLVPEDVDLKYQQQQVAEMKQFLATPNLSSGKRKQFTQSLEHHSKMVRLLQEIPGLMKPGAVVMLLNCSTAASPEGQKFVLDLGHLLVGKDGGKIAASTEDITLLEVEDLWDQAAHYFKNGGVKTWGDSFIGGMWVTHSMKKGTNTSKPTTTTTTKKPVVKKPAVKKPTNPAVKASYTGKWDSSYGVLTLNQSGKSVSGSSTYYGTTVNGTIKDDGKLHFKWSDSNGKKGVGVFELASDGQTFSGSWNYILSDGKTLGNGGGWGGKRIGK